MNNDVSRKSRPVAPVERNSSSTHKQNNIVLHAQLPGFTPEQRRILGNVYQLIQRRRRERLGRLTQAVTAAPVSPVELAEQEA